MTATTSFDILPIGTVAPYRKVGRVEVVDNSAATGAAWVEWYTVRFLTGPKKYREGTHVVCIGSQDVIA